MNKNNNAKPITPNAPAGILAIKAAGAGEESRELIMLQDTRTVLQSLKQQGITDPVKITSTIVNYVADDLEIRNAAIVSKSRKHRIPDSLEPFQAAEILMAMHTVRKICCLEKSSSPDYDLLGIYQEDGPEKGTYATSGIPKLCYRYSPGITRHGISEVEAILMARCQRVKRTKDKNLIAVNNGIFDFDAKKLLPFSPDYVFLGKSHVDYVPNAVSPVIHNPIDNTDWEVEEHMRTLSDDKGVVSLLWETIGACIRPNVPWDKAAWFYSTQGSNGKGTLCALMRNICGDGNHTAVKLSDFSKEFALEPLINASAIINDENDVDIYIDRAATLKAVITGDVFQMNRKFKTPIASQFKGFMVQCINGMPKVKDRSNSFYRRQLVIPFLKNFQGSERKYIKDDYVGRKEVLEYVLWRVLNMDYYELSEPEACKDLLLEYKEANDPVQQFWADMEGRFAWDLLPYEFIYELYKGWLKEADPDAQALGRNTFKNHLQDIVRTSSDIWWVPPKEQDGGKMRDKYLNRKDMIDKPEMLIRYYKVQGWGDDTYHGGDELCKLMPAPSRNRFRGLMRLSRAIEDGWCDEDRNPIQKRGKPGREPAVQAGTATEDGPEPPG